MENLKFDEKGLVVVVVQDVRTGEVRMVAYANQEAVDHTCETGFATFFSRSRGTQWVKGETSGNTIQVLDVYVDCDRDALIYLSLPSGPSCHTGAESCFFSSELAQKDMRALPTFFHLYETLKDRRESTEGKSYTKLLLSRGSELIGAKLREEAGELAEAIHDESEERVVSEAADVLYHVWVGLLSRDIPVEDVSEELRRRFSQSGLAEKASRNEAKE